MNYYLRKRVQNHISRSDMANMLGVNYSFYSAIEKGSVKMPLNLIDKFNEIINRGKENEITGIENKVKADEFWEQMHQKDETGRWELINKMHEFNIDRLEDLVNLLGYKSVGTIYNYLQGRNPVGDEFKKRLYNFFSNEMNIQIPKREQKPKPTYKINNEPRKANAKLDRYYEKTDFKKLMKENNITNVDIANALGVHNSTISNATCKKYKPSYRIIQGVKDYLDNAIVKEEAPSQADCISKSKLLDKCNNEIMQYETTINEYTKQIDILKNKIELTNKLVEMINNM